MEEQKNNGNLNSDTGSEIDLLALFVSCCKAIGRGIAVTVKGIGLALTACFNFCIRHFFWLLGGIATGILIMMFNSLLPKKHYVTGEAMLSCYGIALADIENEVVKLNQIIKTNKTSFSDKQTQWGLNAEQARDLKSISFGYGMDVDNDTIADFAEYISIKAKNIYKEQTLKGGAAGDKIIKTPIQQKVPNIFFLKVETEVIKMQDFQELGNAICNYLNNLPDLQAQQQLQRREWENRLAEIDRQRILLDSMLRLEYFENSRLKAASYGQGAEHLVLADQKQNGIPFDYKDVIALTDQKSAIQTLLAQSEQMVNIVSNFQPVLTSSHTKKIWLGLLWIGLFIATAIIYDYRKPIGRYIKEQRQR